MDMQLDELRLKMIRETEQFLERYLREPPPPRSPVFPLGLRKRRLARPRSGSVRIRLERTCRACKGSHGRRPRATRPVCP